MSSDERDYESEDVNRSEMLSSMGGDEPTKPSTRRRFVTGVASVAASLGFVGTASALDPTGKYALREYERTYESPAAVRDAFETHAEELLAELADEGLLDTSVEELLAEEDVNVSSFLVGDEPTAHLNVETEVEAGQLAINVEPEVGRSFAILDRTDGDATVIDPGSEVGTSSCRLAYGCMGGGCVCTEYEVCCDFDNQSCYIRSDVGTCSSCQYCLNDSCEDICGF